MTPFQQHLRDMGAEDPVQASENLFGFFRALLATPDVAAAHDEPDQPPGIAPEDGPL